MGSNKMILLIPPGKSCFHLVVLLDSELIKALYKVYFGVYYRSSQLFQYLSNKR
jgi:hypothetical protein